MVQRRRKATGSMQFSNLQWRRCCAKLFMLRGSISWMDVLDLRFAGIRVEINKTSLEVSTQNLTIEHICNAINHYTLRHCPYR